MTPQREILWNVPPAVLTAVYVLSALSAVWIVGWFWRRSQLWTRGTVSPPPDWNSGLRRLADYLLRHRVIRRDPFAGWMHLLIFWGFMALVLATTLVGIQHHLGVEFLTGWFYCVFSLFADLGGLAFCIGVGMALARRQVPSRLLPSVATTRVLWLMLLVGLTGFLVEAARIARDFPPFEVFSPVGYLLAWVFDAVGIRGESVRAPHLTLWILHALAAVAFFVVIPLTVLRHIVLGAWSVARTESRPGILHEPAAPITTGVELPHFRRLDLAQADACLTCGRCSVVCPANAAGKPLDPRSVVLGLRAHLDEPHRPLPEIVADDTLWSCLTCHACDAACPVAIQIAEKIVHLRRGRVAVGKIPETAAEALSASAQKFNPFAQANSSRMEWASGLAVPVAADGEPVEWLYWIGCAGSFDPAGRSVSRAMIAILNHLDIPFRVLGCRERCTGDPARRMGEEGLWRELAVHNQQTIAGHRVQTILTHCPHCFSAFRNEYPAVGSMPRVLHHSQFLREQLESGRLTIAPTAGEAVTYHDPCYLGRANGETTAPRAVLDRTTTRRIELEQAGANSFCCGGGGGQMWLDVAGTARVETLRAQQVAASGAGTVATGCPFCRVMLEAGRAGLPPAQADWRVRDLAELVAENLGAPKR